MQQLIILIVALALAGGVYLFLTISKKKNKEQTKADEYGIYECVRTVFNGEGL